MPLPLMVYNDLRLTSGVCCAAVGDHIFCAGGQP